MAGSEGEHGSKENSGGGCFSAQAWCACQILTERERNREGKCPASGDLKIYPLNLLRMDLASASLQHI